MVGHYGVPKHRSICKSGRPSNGAPKSWSHAATCAGYVLYEYSSYELVMGNQAKAVNANGGRVVMGKAGVEG